MINKIFHQLFPLKTSKQFAQITPKKPKIQSIKLKKNFLKKIKDMISKRKDKKLHRRIIAPKIVHSVDQPLLTNLPIPLEHEAPSNSKSSALLDSKSEDINQHHMDVVYIDDQGSHVEFHQLIQNDTSRNALTNSRLSNIEQHWISPSDHIFWSQQKKKNKTHYMVCVRQENIDFLTLKSQNISQIETAQDKVNEALTSSTLSEADKNKLLKKKEMYEALHLAEKNKQYDHHFPIAYMSSIQMSRQYVATQLLEGKISEDIFNQQMDILENAELYIKCAIIQTDKTGMSYDQQVMILTCAKQHHFLKNNKNIVNFLSFLQETKLKSMPLMRKTIAFFKKILNSNEKTIKKITDQYNTNIIKGMVKEDKNSSDVVKITRLGRQLLRLNQSNKQNKEDIEDMLSLVLQEKNVLSRHMQGKILQNLSDSIILTNRSCTPVQIQNNTQMFLYFAKQAIRLSSVTNENRLDAALKSKLIQTNEMSKVSSCLVSVCFSKYQRS